jgi:hypothetical protein
LHEERSLGAPGLIVRRVWFWLWRGSKALGLAVLSKPLFTADDVIK